VGVRPTADGDADVKGVNVSDYSVILFDEIYTFTLAQLRRIAEFMARNEDIHDEGGGRTRRKFLAAGDTFQLLPRERLAVTDSRAHYNAIIERLFPAHASLETNKRLRSEEDRERLAAFKRDCFSDMDPDTIMAKYFTRVYDARAVRGKAVCFTNRDVDTLNELLHARAVSERKAAGEHVHEHADTPAYYVGMVVRCRRQLKARNGARFITNFEYRVEEILPWGAKLWDFGASSARADGDTGALNEASFTNLNAHFTPNYAHTGHSCQGLTFDGEVTIFGYNNWHCTREWLYVAGTRTRRLCDVHYFRGNVQPHGKTETDLKAYIARKLKSCLAADVSAGRRFTEATAATVDDVLALLRTQDNHNGEVRVVWHLTCTSCAREMQIAHSSGDEDQLSIDRLNNSLAHIKGNIQLLCLRCNKTKH
jgi:hypothetical protein